MAAVASMRKGPPLDLALAGAIAVAPGVSLCEDGDRASVFVWGMVVSCWDAADVVGRRVAAVQLVETRSAGHAEVADGFGVGIVTLWRWRRAWQAEGVAGLAPQAKGTRRASKLTEAKVAEIRSARAEGRSMRTIAIRVGVSPDSVCGRWGPDRLSASPLARALSPPSAGSPGSARTSHRRARSGPARRAGRSGTGDLRGWFASLGRGVGDPACPGRHWPARGGHPDSSLAGSWHRSWLNRPGIRGGS